MKSFEKTSKPANKPKTGFDIHLLFPAELLQLYLNSATSICQETSLKICEFLSRTDRDGIKHAYITPKQPL